MAAKPERRHLTVLFCDLVGSTRFIVPPCNGEEFRDVDPGEVEKLFTATCADAIKAFGGKVSQLLGDGVLAVFGHPEASEHAVENAVRAGLRITADVARLIPPSPFQHERLSARVGIATGVVVTDEPGPDGHVPIRGLATVLAQRLQLIAAQDEVLVSDRTRTIAAKRMEFESVGTMLLKGLPQPVQVWRATGLRDAMLRVSQDVQTPLVGRSRNLDVIMRLWREAASGQGRGLLVRGEPGIGKSRLVLEALDRCGVDSSQMLQFQCEPLYANTALHPVIEHIRRCAGIAADAPSSLRFDRLAAWYGASEQDTEAVALFADLLSLGSDERYPLPALSPRRQRERLCEALLCHVRMRSRDRALVVLIEDLHWIDPTTEEFLQSFWARLEEMPVLLLCTARPDFAPDWLDRLDVESMHLAGLNAEDALQLVADLSAGRIERTDSERIVRLTDGVPIFIEELTKAVLDTGVVSALDGPPPTLADLLGARLDQVGKARRVAEVASVAGREFSYGLLSRLCDMECSELEQALAALLDAGLVVRVAPSQDAVASEPGRPADGEPALTYAFRHALVQAAAYDRLTHRERPAIHRRIAETLQQFFPQMVEDEPEVLAHHWTESGDMPCAVAGWLTAGRHASQRCEYMEAIICLRRGLSLVGKIDDGALRLEQELALRLALGPVLITTQGAGTAEVVDLYRRALELCGMTPPSSLHFGAHWGWWRITMDHRTGQERADGLIVLARQLGKPDLTVQAHHCQWATLYMMGQHEKCLQHTEAGLALYDGVRDSVHSGLYGGHDAKVCAFGESALSFWMLGDYARADTRVAAALAWAGEIAHVGSRVHAMDYALVLQKFLRNYEAVERQGAELAAYAKEQRLRVFHAKGNFFCGWARALQGKVDEGLAQMLDGIQSERAADTPHDFTLYLEMLAEVMVLAGRHAEALKTIDEAFEVAGGHGIVYWNAELHRRRGEVLGALQQYDDGEAALRESLAWARSQGARSLELRAAVSLARLQLNRGTQVVMDLVRSVYALLKGEVDTPDLSDARSVLGNGA